MFLDVTFRAELLALGFDLADALLEIGLLGRRRLGRGTATSLPASVGPQAMPSFLAMFPIDALCWEASRKTDSQYSRMHTVGTVFGLPSNHHRGPPVSESLAHGDRRHPRASSFRVAPPGPRGVWVN